MGNYEKKSNKLVNFLAGNGFYIVLLLCIAAIAVSAYILFFTGDDENDIDLNAGMETLELGPESMDMPVINETADEPVNEAIINPPLIDDVFAGTERPVIKATPTPTSAPEPTPTPQPSALPVPVQAAFIWPLNGQVVMPYSINELIKSKTMNDWRAHTGIDISASPGAKVASIGDGIVEDIYDDPFMGTTIVIDHGNGMKSVYSNLMPEVTVAKGKTVSAGDTIAGVGDTAIVETAETPHVHLEIIKDGALIDPLSILPSR